MVLGVALRRGLQRFDGRYTQIDGRGKNRLLDDLCQFHGPGLGIYKLLAPICSRIKPGPESFRLTFRSFPERHYGFIGGAQTVIRDGKNGREQVGPIFAEDLDDVPVGWRIHQLK